MLRSARSLVLVLAAGALSTACADDRLHKAAHQGDIATVKQLLARTPPPDVDERDSSGGTALHAAMFQDNLQIVELLLAAGFDPNAVGPRNGYTPLHDAVWGNNAAAADLLLRRGARADVKGKDGLTPLAKAKADNKPALVAVFRRHGVER